MFAREVRQQTKTDSGHTPVEFFTSSMECDEIDGMEKNRPMQKATGDAFNAADSTKSTKSTPTPAISGQATPTATSGLRSSGFGTGCTREETEAILSQLMGTAKRRRSGTASSGSFDHGSSARVAVTGELEAQGDGSYGDDTDTDAAKRHVDGNEPLACETVNDIQKYRRPVHLLWL
jgi:hypothetical protein